MITPTDIKKYYLTPGILEEIMRVGEGREVVPVFKAKFYGRRPSYMPYITDYKIAVTSGATSFHMSVEKWKNVKDLENAADNKYKLDELRVGWDLIFDIDAKKGLEYAQITAEEIINFLKDRDVENIYIKFSGSRGFHIGINGNALPNPFLKKPIASHYPELLHKIVFYIKKSIESILKERFKEIDKKADNIEDYVEIEGNWSYRHLFRAPYSLNEKTWLISIPLFYYQLKKFNKELATIENFKGVRIKFLEKWKPEELELLCYEAVDFVESTKYKDEWNKQLESLIKKRIKGYDEVNTEIKKAKAKVIRAHGKIYIEEDFFPPCIKNILSGLEDGRKRGLFILLNFLHKMGWSYEQIEQKIHEWNKKNKEPLKESYVKAQLNYFKKNIHKIEEIPPPNCDNLDYYKDLGVCVKEKDKRCIDIKNPIVYAYKQKYKEAKKNDKSNINRNTGRGKNNSS